MGIKSFELDPTHENLKKTLVEDLLNRNADFWHFARLCNEIDNKEELIRELVELSYDETLNYNCSLEVLENLLSSIEEEKEKIFEKDTLEQSLAGKDPLEKARIMAEYNRRKMKKINQNTDKDEGGK